jgi:cytoskeletal protein CcmA (bactofilin family)
MMFKRKSEINNDNADKLFINKGSSIHGTINCQSLLVIDGDFEGQINSKLLEITESGSVKGTINAESVVVAGVVNANIKCTGRLKIAATGKVNGEVQYGSLEVSLGGVSVGNLEQTANMRVVRSQVNLANITDKS